MLCNYKIHLQSMAMTKKFKYNLNSMKPSPVYRAT